MDNVLKRLPELRETLSKISTEYAYQYRYIGEAISMLILLEDIIIEKNESRKNESV
jgi:hypothetical protein